MTLATLARPRRQAALLVVAALLMLHARVAIAGCLIPDLASLALERARVVVSAPCHEIAPEATEVCLAQCVHAAGDFLSGTDLGVSTAPMAPPQSLLFLLPWSTTRLAAAPVPAPATGPPLIYLLRRLLT